MVIIDTNIFIYISNGTLDTGIVANEDIAHASVTKIEALGFPELTANELLLLNALFSESQHLTLTDQVVGRAVMLRQARRMGLGDAIIAATALEHDLTLWTANVDDFKHIEGLKLLDPTSQ
jgi:predicted nucleic acid-binding protein